MKGKKGNMAKRAREKNGYIIRTLDLGNLYMDQHKETLEAMMGHVQWPPLAPFNRDIY